MSVYQNINGTLTRIDASDLVQLAAVDTEGILGGTPGATTNGQTLVDQLAADDVQAQTDIGQIKTDLPNKLDIENQQILGAWNLNKYPYVSTTTTQSGITFTDLGDGRIKASTNGGTSSGFGQFTFWNTSNPLSLVAGKKYYLSGAPVSGTTTDKVRLLIAFEDANNANRITVICPENGEVEFTMPVGYHFHWFSYAVVESGVSLNDVIVSPQISTQPRTVFSPYAMTNRELTERSTIAKTENIGSMAINACKEGNIVCLFFDSMSALTQNYATDDVILTLPESLWPAYTISFRESLNNKRLLIEQGTGKIKTKESLTSGSSIRGVCTYISK